MTELYAHQEVTAQFLHEKKQAFCTSDCGTGKTLSCLAAFDRAEGPKRLLVVAPLSILKPSWGDDIDKFTPHLTWAIAHGTPKKRLKALNSDTDVVITNHDAVKWIMRDHPTLIEGFTHLVIDEFTAYKNRTTDRGKAIARIAPQMRYRWLLSGTPNSNTITDIWHPAALVDGGERLGRRFYAFRDQVQNQIMVGGFPKWEDKPGALDIVSVMLADVTIRFTLEDCIDMPKHTVSERLLTPPRWLMKAYRELESRHVLTTDNGRISTTHASARARKLLQLLSGAVYDEEGEAVRVHTERAELVMQLVAEREQTVVAFNWRHELGALTDLATRMDIPFGEIHGGVPPANRPAIVDDFQAGKTKVLFCQPQSASHGLTLTAATTTIWASPTPTHNAEHYHQFNHRIYRAGQTERTETIRIAYEGTVEMEVYKALDGKMSSMEDLLCLFSQFTDIRNVS